jgi:copper(I)-binding protein
MILRDVTLVTVGHMPSNTFYLTIKANGEEKDKLVPATAKKWNDVVNTQV